MGAVLSESDSNSCPRYECLPAASKSMGVLDKNRPLRKHVRSSPRFEPRTAKVEFQVGNDPKYGPSPYVGLTIHGQKESLECMADKDELVLTEANGKEVIMVFDYPMKNPLELPIIAPLS